MAPEPCWPALDGDEVDDKIVIRRSRIDYAERFSAMFASLAEEMAR